MKPAQTNFDGADDFFLTLSLQLDDLLKEHELFCKTPETESSLSIPSLEKIIASRKSRFKAKIQILTTSLEVYEYKNSKKDDSDLRARLDDAKKIILEQLELILEKAKSNQTSTLQKSNNEAPQDYAGATQTTEIFAEVVSEAPSLEITVEAQPLLIGYAIRTPHERVMGDLIAFLNNFQQRFPRAEGIEQEKTVQDKMGLLISGLLLTCYHYSANKYDFKTFKYCLEEQFANGDLVKELEKSNSIFYPLYCLLLDIINAFIAVFRAIVNCFAGKEVITRNAFFKHPEASLASDVKVLHDKCDTALQMLDTLEQDAEKSMQVVV
jgi:hypothetical protein